VIVTENEQSTTTDEKADKSLDSDEDKLKHEQLVTQKNIIDVNTSGKTENGKISDSGNDSNKDSTTDNTDRSPPTTNSEQSNRLPDTTDVQTSVVVDCSFSVTITLSFLHPFVSERSASDCCDVAISVLVVSVTESELSAPFSMTSDFDKFGTIKQIA
jgi:alpha-D-ribose 1-methylphosphonate 5-triphosphate synthase subunit PhnI